MSHEPIKEISEAQKKKEKEATNKLVEDQKQLAADIIKFESEKNKFEAEKKKK